MTRTKNELDLIVPERFLRFQQNQGNRRYTYGAVSRFIPQASATPSTAEDGGTRRVVATEAHGIRFQCRR